MCSPGDRVERSLATFAFTSASQGSGLDSGFAVTLSWGTMYLLQLWCGWRDFNSHAQGHQFLRLACIAVPPHPRINLGPVSTLNLLRSWLTFTSRPDLALCTLEVETGIEPAMTSFADSRFSVLATRPWCVRADSSRHKPSF